jgi:hypothetical protein
MIHRGILLLFLAATVQLHAGWITWTNGTPGVTATGSFDGGSGSYAGTATAAISNVIDGGSNGVPGISASSFANGVLTTSFLNNFPVNSNGTVTALANGYNNTQDAYLITLDFTGMANGFLPSGTLFTVLDLDSLENYRNVTAFAPGGAQVGTAWLSPLGGIAGLLDFSTLVDGVDSTGSFTPPSVSFSGGLYQMIGPAANESTSLLGFRTTQNLERITLAFDQSNNQTALFAGGGPQIAIGTEAVPEPGTMTMFGIASVAGLLLRLKKR